jgi:hypothetical protein
MAYKPTGRPNGRPRAPLSDRVLEAIEVEAERALADLPPLTLQQLSDATKLSRTACRKWRLDQRYQDAVNGRLTGLILERMEELEAERKYRATRKRDRRQWWLGESRNFWATLTKRQKAEHIRREVRAWTCKTWPGHPVRSMVDGQLYDTPEELAEHYLATGRIPAIWRE